MIPCVEACSPEDIARYSIQHVSQYHTEHLISHTRDCLGLLEGNYPTLDVVFKVRYGFHTCPNHRIHPVQEGFSVPYHLNLKLRMVCLSILLNEF